MYSFSFLLKLQGKGNQFLHSVHFPYLNYRSTFQESFSQGMAVPDIEQEYAITPTLSTLGANPNTPYPRIRDPLY